MEIKVLFCGITNGGGKEGMRLAMSRKAEITAICKLATLILPKVARWQNLILSFLRIASGWRAWGCNPRKGQDKMRSVAEP